MAAAARRAAGIEENFYAYARDAQLDGVPSVARAEVEQADAFLAIQAPHNTRALAGVDPARIARLARARAPLAELRLAKRWCGTLWPTPAGAQQAGMGEDAFAAFVCGARDLICDLRAGGRLSADGEVVQEDGAFR
jgi:aminopeptidase